MNLLDEFKNDCPLTIMNLESWLKRLVSEIDKTYEIKGDLLTTLYNTNEGAIISIDADTINGIVEAIEQGKNLRTTLSASIVGATCFCVDGDDYKSFKLYIVGALGGSTMQKIVFEIESLAGSVRLCTKSVTAF